MSVCVLYVFLFFGHYRPRIRHMARRRRRRRRRLKVAIMLLYRVCVCARARVCDTVFFYYGKTHKVLIPPSAGRIWRLYCCGGVLSTHNSSAQENNIIILYLHTLCHGLTTTVRPAATRWPL